MDTINVEHSFYSYLMVRMSSKLIVCPPQIAPVRSVQEEVRLDVPSAAATLYFKGRLGIGSAPTKLAFLSTMLPLLSLLHSSPNYIPLPSENQVLPSVNLLSAAITAATLGGKCFKLPVGFSMFVSADGTSLNSDSTSLTVKSG